MVFTPITPTYSVEDLYTKYADTQNVLEHPILAPVIAVLNHTNLIDAKDVAEQLQVNDRKLSNAVELHTGQSLHQFILDWRFMQSQQLLRNTELPYAEVSNRCGYANENVLIAQYKTRLHTTPYTFRTGHRIRNSNYAINR